MNNFSGIIDGSVQAEELWMARLVVWVHGHYNPLLLAFAPPQDSNQIASGAAEDRPTSIIVLLQHA